MRVAARPPTYQGDRVRTRDRAPFPGGRTQPSSGLFILRRPPVVALLARPIRLFVGLALSQRSNQRSRGVSRPPTVTTGKISLPTTRVRGYSGTRLPPSPAAYPQGPAKRGERTRVARLQSLPVSRHSREPFCRLGVRHVLAEDKEIRRCAPTYPRIRLPSELRRCILANVRGDPARLPPMAARSAERLPPYQNHAPRASFTSGRMLFCFQLAKSGLPLLASAITAGLPL